MITLTADVKDVLGRCIVTATSVVLPPGQLDRKLYTQVNKVLEAYGGRWNRAAKAHIFDSDPRVKLATALATGKAENEQQLWQSFYTPLSLVKDIVDWIDPKPGEVGLEPSAGDGRFVRECVARGAVMDACEIRPELADGLYGAGAALVVTADFLILQAWERQYDFIVMNPPFQKKQDAKHILHAWKFLKPGGRMAAIASAGVTFRADREYEALRELPEENDHYEELPEGTFKESGTNVKAVVMYLVK